MSLTILLITFTLRLMAPESGAVIIPVGERIDPYRQLIFAVGMVESQNNDTALNRLEMAYGRYQVRQIRLDDFNQKSGKSYKLAEMYDPIKAREVFYFYCNDPYDLEGTAKRWNGSGKQVIEYWEKVQKYL